MCGDGEGVWRPKTRPLDAGSMRAGEEEAILVQSIPRTASESMRVGKERI